ncbi:hypothetical protein FOA43_003965 [Brettanomyces nanus]|uniref:MICOS complex subunit n=1 Tax=Eeniella nana TaxID=13502 RepID=A0A875SCS8_EENNA|nr:uncharacterized protein FOA43_003965 [Brettanomyces nanus]QPG76574.1 hypothetical protein FOA43_003965 [Brettanomyces nanus]
MFNIFRVGLPVASSVVMYTCLKNPVLNEGKRNFYANNTADIIPGSPQEEGSELVKLVAKRENGSGSALQKQFKRLRLWTDEYLEAVRRCYIEKSDAYFRKERQVTDTITSLHDKTELLWPNSIYILTGFMTGLVLTRKRNILLRATVPLACGLVAFSAFMPATFNKTASWLSGVEEHKLPDVYRKQAKIIEKTEDLVQRSESLKQENEKIVSKYYQKTRKTIGDMTGLTVDEPVTDKKD